MASAHVRSASVGPGSFAERERSGGAVVSAIGAMVAAAGDGDLVDAAVESRFYGASPSNRIVR
jgi:hypothetical protein